MVGFATEIVKKNLLLFLLLLVVAKAHSQSDAFIKHDTLSLLDVQQGYNYTDTLLVNSITYKGNKTTKERILLAETDIPVDQKIEKSELKKRIEQTAERLYNLQLFVWVQYTIIQVAQGEIEILFTVQERWYLWPVPIFSLADRNISAWLDKMDFERIDYGLHLVQKNFRGRNEELKTNIQFGFNKKYEVFYTVPNLNKKQNIGMQAGLSYYHSRSLDYATIGNEQLFYKSGIEYPIKKQYATYSLVYRNNVENKYIVTLNIGQTGITDSVLYKNPDFMLGQKHRQHIQFDISRLINRRNTFSYPVSGYYINAGITYKQFVGSAESPMLMAYLKASKYLPIKSRLSYAVGVDLQYKYANKLSYYENKALGYKSYIRGFELYVVDGQNFAILKNSFQYTLLKKQKIQLPWVKNPKFDKMPLFVLLSVFNDAGYVQDNIYANGNWLANRFLSGTGVGVHFVSYYDRVLRLEYTLTNLNKGSFFIHNTIPF